VVFPRGTIVLEKALLHPLEENRRRFTLAHEASHYLIDRTISTALFRRECANAHPCSTQELRKLFTFHERQIDRMAAAILMPKFIMENILSLLTAQNPITIYGDNLISAEDKLLVQKMATMMCVSYTAFFIRLKELGLHHRRSTEEYIIEQMCLGNGGISQ
jgi:Zn-dependent peptidase ImmA (M78 family)